jgi:Domain of unknown function (DUF4337)
MSDEAPSEPFEHAEHAEKAAHDGSPFLLKVSVTIAILAVVAATVGSLESLETARTLTEQNAATLLQNKASDAWAFFQAKSLKKNAFDIASQLGGASSNHFSEQAARYEGESREAEKQAAELQQKVEERLHESEHHERRHLILTTAVTLVHVSIAITTIAIIMKGRRWPWYLGIGLGAAGAVLAAFAYL